MENAAVSVMSVSPFLFAPELECGVEKPSGSCGGCLFFSKKIFHTLTSFFCHGLRMY